MLLTLLLTQPTGHNRQFHRHFAIKLPSATHLALLQLTRVPVRMPNRHRLPERCGAVMCGVWCGVCGIALLLLPLRAACLRVRSANCELQPEWSPRLRPLRPQRGSSYTRLLCRIRHGVCNSPSPPEVLSRENCSGPRLHSEGQKAPNPQ